MRGRTSNALTRRRGRPRFFAAAAALLAAAGAGGVVIFSDGFESGNFLAWDERWTASGHLTITTTPENVRTGTRAAQGSFAGLPDDGKMGKWFMPGYDDVFFRTWMRFSPTYNPGGDTHFLHILGNQTNDRWSAHGTAGTTPTGTDYFVSNADLSDYSGTLAGAGSFIFYSYYPEKPCQWGDVRTQPNPFLFEPNRWYCVDFRLRANDIGATNGFQELRVDGRLIMSWYHLRWRDSEILQCNNVWIVLRVGTPTAGTIWFDDISVSTEFLPLDVDTESPTISIRSPSDTGTHATARSAIDLAGTAGDDYAVMSVSWTNESGSSGSASGSTNWTVQGIPLVMGENAIDVTAQDAGANRTTDRIVVTRQTDTESPSVQILSPTANARYFTRENLLSPAGSATDDGDLALVSVTNGQGWGGEALGRYAWYRNYVPLSPGENVITVRAIDTMGFSGTDTLTVTRLVSGGPPAVAILEPTSEAVWDTDAGTVVLCGTAADDDRVEKVTWESSRGFRGTASGTDVWNAGVIPLVPGTNVLTVTAEDDEELTASVELTIACRWSRPPGGDGIDPSDLFEGAGEGQRIRSVLLPREGGREIYVAASPGSLSTIVLRLYSPMGQVVAEWSGEDLVVVGEDVYAARLGAAPLSSGAYLAQLIEGEETYTAPVVLLR